MNAIARTLHKLRREQKTRNENQCAGVASVGIIYMVQLTPDQEKLERHLKLDLETL